MELTRREFIKWLSATTALGAVSGCATTPTEKTAGRVVVVGAGWAGATAAKYIRKWGSNIEVTLVERNSEFISCPLSNLVLGGSKTIQDMIVGYDGLKKYGIKVLRDEAVSVDPEKREVKLERGGTLGYDRLVLAPGIDFIYEQIPGLKTEDEQGKVLHAWKAGTQTVLLRKQLENMRDGGVFAMHIPKSPYRCPPGPYERACQVAHYFKTKKPKSKVLILDANDDVQSKKGLFTKAWNERYKGIVEYKPNSELVDVDVKTLTAKLQFDNVKADVLNVIPPQRAGKIATDLKLANVNARFCGVDFLTYESQVAKNIHVLGDAIQSAPAMPKSGHMANQHGKVCASAVVALLNGQPVNDQPMVANTCYSFIDDKEVVHVASVHRYDPAKKTMVTVEGSGGLSPGPTEQEGQYALAWTKNIWADMLA